MLLALIALEKTKCPERRFLGYVLGVLLVARQPAGEVVGRVEVRQDGSCSKRSRVAVRCTPVRSRVLVGTDFSLWGFVLASAKIHRQFVPLMTDCESRLFYSRQQNGRISPGIGACRAGLTSRRPRAASHATARASRGEITTWLT